VKLPFAAVVFRRPVAERIGREPGVRDERGDGPASGFADTLTPANGEPSARSTRPSIVVKRCSAAVSARGRTALVSTHATSLGA